MSHVLICYGSIEGQTRKISNAVARKIVSLGHTAHVVDASDPGDDDLRVPDAVIVAAPLHEHHYPASVRRYLKSLGAEVRERPGMFLSVSLAVMSDEEADKADLDRLSRTFVEKSEWSPQETHQVAGALRYTELSFFKRFILKQIMRAAGGPTDTHEDYEFTDWAELDKLVTDLRPQVSGQPSGSLS